jgi:hypothetical protein
MWLIFKNGGNWFFRFTAVEIPVTTTSGAFYGSRVVGGGGW